MRNKLTQDGPTLFIDQYGNKVWASSAKELCEKCYYRGSARKQYMDFTDGSVLWTGYIVGQQWFAAYKPASAGAN